MKMRTMRRIRADMRNRGYDLPDWVPKTSYRCNYTPDRDSYLLYGDGQLTCTQDSLKSQFLIMISPAPSHLSLSCPQFYHHLKTMNVCQIRRIKLHPVESDEDTVPESISNTEDSLNWNEDLNNPNDCEDNCMANDESDIKQEYSIEDPQCPEQQDVSAAPNDSRLIYPTQKSKTHTDQQLVTLNAIEMRMNKGVK